MSDQQKWIMMTYKPPKARTSAAKVALWRKLKKLGVYQVQDAVCILPASEKNSENLQWISEEVNESGGEASVWSIASLSPEKEKKLRIFFLDQVNVKYQKLMTVILEITTELELRAQWNVFNRIKTQDYLKSPLAVEVKAAFETRMHEINKMENER